MKIWGVIGIVLVGVFAFMIGQRLSADAVGMAIGVLFGVFASIPAALLVVASGRRRQNADFDDDDEFNDDGYGDHRGRRRANYQAPPQAPVIIFAPPASQLPPGFDNMIHPSAGYEHVNGRRPTAQRALTGPTAPHEEGGRAFRVIGEREEWITEW